MNHKKIKYSVVAFSVLLAFVFLFYLGSTKFLEAEVDNRKNYWQAKSEFPFNRPISGLTNEEEDSFVIGRSFFTVPWVEAPSATTARDGLGPLFNSNTCAGCHFKRKDMDVIDAKGEVNRHLLFKLGRPAQIEKGNKELLLQDDNYGGQIAIHGTKNDAFEAKPNLRIKYKDIVLSDSQKIRLRYFEPYLTNLNYGKLDEDSQISLRLVITLVGMGLVEKITPELILQYADENDKDKDGISGRPNWVVNPQNGKQEIGKYGYKLSQSTLMMQSADAAFNDMSLSSPLFPKENCSKNQTSCVKAPKGLRTDIGGDLELPMVRLKGITSYLQSLKAPPPYNKEHEGFRVFKKMGCASCHRTDYQLDDDLHASPFSDYLLHDMGKGLADSRYEMRATPFEWRTAPLWGLSAKIKAGIPLLHDGRAQTIAEAVLWHGGEAKNIKQRFIKMDSQKRQKLINFLESL